MEIDVSELSQASADLRERAENVPTWQIPIPRMLIEIPIAMLIAALGSSALQLAVSKLDVPVPSHEPAAIGAALGMLLVVALFALVVAFWRHWPTWATLIAVGSLAALTTIELALPLQGTRYYLGGISIDQAFRTQYLTRLTDSILLRDMNYIDTPPYYPAGWFWLGGRFADLIGFSGWEAYKPWSILTMAVTSALSFTLWSLVVQRPIAALLALVTSLIGLGVPATEPYGWTIAALLSPTAVIALRAFGGGHRESRTALILVGLVLGLSGAVYTLYFGFTGLVLVALASTVWFSAIRPERSRICRLLAKRLALVGIVAVLPILLVWTPYLSGALANGALPAGAALRYLPEASALLPFPMLQVSVVGLVSLIGTVWLLVRFTSDDTARALSVLVLVGYLWFALSTLSLVADTTLLAFRVRIPLEAAFASAGVLGILDAMNAFSRVRPHVQRNIVVVAAVLGAIAAASVAQAVPLMHSHDLDLAYSDYYPQGTNARSEVDLTQDGAWYDDLDETILAETGKRPDDLVLLTNVTGLLVLHPYWGFQQVTDHYANPLADYDGRLNEVGRWAAASDAQDFVARLDDSRYRAPSVFVLSEAADGYHAKLTRDVFPEQPNVEEYDVVFNSELFSPDHFVRRQVGPFTVFVRR